MDSPDHVKGASSDECPGCIYEREQYEKQFVPAPVSPSPAVTDAAGQVLAAWASRQHRMRDIVRRPWGVFGGEVRGELLYFNALVCAELATDACAGCNKDLGTKAPATSPAGAPWCGECPRWWFG